MQRNLLFQYFLIAQHVSGDTPPITRSSKTVTTASGFTYVFGCRPLQWLSHRSGRQPRTFVKPEAAITVLSSWWWAVCRPKHVEQLRNTGIINSATRLHLVGSFYEIYITMHGSMNIMTCFACTQSKKCQVSILMPILLSSLMASVSVNCWRSSSYYTYHQV